MATDPFEPSEPDGEKKEKRAALLALLDDTLRSLTEEQTTLPLLRLQELEQGGILYQVGFRACKQAAASCSRQGLKGRRCFGFRDGRAELRAA